jgi:hypothetical protein
MEKMALMKKSETTNPFRAISLISVFPDLHPIYP